MKTLILASSSPRRKDILLREGYSFSVIPSDKEEIEDKNLPPEKYALSCAIKKTQDVFSKVEDKHSTVVLGADTVVSLDGQILGKPKDEKEAEEMLKNLSGKTHEVYTAYVFLSGNLRESGFIKSIVEFNSLTKADIDEYLKSGLWQGKAGSYGIQDGFNLVKRYEGDFDNIVGLPISEIKEDLEEFLK